MNTRRIGVAIQIQHPHAEDQQLYCGVRDYAAEHPGFLCVLAPFAAHDLDNAPARRSPFDGVLAQATPELVAAAERRGVPVIDVWRDSRVCVPIHCVFPDFAKAGRMVGKHLASRGFEHFGYVINRDVQSQVSMCDDSLFGGDALGYAAYVEARGFRCNRFLAPLNVTANAKTWSRWSLAIRHWLMTQPKPLGLFVPNDMLCRHIADLGAEIGINVPHDLGLVCADNEPDLCLLSSPSLTAVDLGFRKVGYEAAALLDRVLGSRPAKLEREILLIEPHTLHARSSTDATVVNDPLVAGAMRFILENTHLPIKVSDVCRAVHATRRTLERRFREVLGQTMMEEITRCRLERLKRRLAESKTPIKILADDSGFNSARVLYDTFVREEGISPSEYRARRRMG